MLRYGDFAFALLNNTFLPNFAEIGIAVNEGWHVFVQHRYLAYETPRQLL